MLDSGVQKVIWIFTKDRKVWIAERGKPWLIVDWDHDIELIEKITLNIDKLLKEGGIAVIETAKVHRRYPAEYREIFKRRRD